MNDTYPSRVKTRKYFIGAILLLLFQMILGIAASTNFLSRDIALPISFDILRALHLNAMVLWILLGFIGALYYLLPGEVGRDIKHPKLIDFQFWFLMLIGIGIILSEMFFTGKNWWLVEGREYIEAGRLWDILLTLGLLSVVYNVAMTIREGKNKMSSPMLVLSFGAVGSILMYIPGEIWFNSLVAAEYFRWWVVHYWVEATFELIAAGALALVLLAMTDVKRELIEKYLAIEVALILLTGIIGQGHHYYWMGAPAFWFFLGGLFSALEPVPLFLMVWAAYKDLKENKKTIENKVALYMIAASVIGNFFGAGVFGFAHTLPQVNYFTHGTQITAAHAHFATPGTYMLLVLGITYLAVPELSGILNFSQHRGKIGFWIMVLGFLNMIIALMISGVVQVYMQRMQGLSFLTVQNMLLPFYGWRMLGGIIAFVGGIIIAYDLIMLSSGKTGKPLFSKRVLPVSNPYYLTALLFMAMAVLIAMDSALASVNLLPFFNGLHWLRLHFITIGAIMESCFGFLPALVASWAKKPIPSIRWDIWISLNTGMLTLLVGIPLNNAALIYAGGTLIFIAAVLLLMQLLKLHNITHVSAQAGRNFYIAGLGYLLLGIIVGTGLFLGWDVSLLGISVPREVHIHANAFGFVGLVFAGLLVDTYPKFANRPFAIPKSVNTIFWLMVIGVAGLILGPWFDSKWFIVPGLLLYTAATILLLLNFIKPLIGDYNSLTPGILHIGTSYTWVFVPIIANPFIMLKVVPGTDIEAAAPQALIYGWVLQFGFALIPYMFASLMLPDEIPKLGGNWFSLITVNMGAIFLWTGIFIKDYQPLLYASAYIFWMFSIIPNLVVAAAQESPTAQILQNTGR